MIMYVCMCACVHAHTYTHTHAKVCVYGWLLISTFRSYVYTHMYVLKYYSGSLLSECVYISICMCITLHGASRSLLRQVQSSRLEVPNSLGEDENHDGRMALYMGRPGGG